MISIIHKVFKLFFFLRYRHVFRTYGLHSKLEKPLKIVGGKRISIGDNVTIRSFAYLASAPLTGEEPSLLIDDGAVLGHFNHIYCTKKIIIEKNVLTADKVYIADQSHSYTEVDVPINDQPIKQLKEVVIGEGSWLGENVCVIGCKIGKHCVVGANSVVNKDVPDYCVVAGAPAVIIKR